VARRQVANRCPWLHGGNRGYGRASIRLGDHGLRAWGEAPPRSTEAPASPSHGTSAPSIFIRSTRFPSTVKSPLARRSCLVCMPTRAIAS